MEARSYKDVEIGVDFFVCVWENLEMNSEGVPHDVKGYRHLTAQVYGDLGGAVVQLCGAILPDKYEALIDIETIASSSHDVLLVKPIIVGGDKHTKVTIGLVCRR